MSPLLDWRDRCHWSDFEAACLFCHQPTHLRDDYRRATHKVCAEEHPVETARPPQRSKAQ